MNEGVDFIHKVRDERAHQCDGCFCEGKGAVYWNTMFYVYYTDGSYLVFCVEHLLDHPELVRLAPILG